MELYDDAEEGDDDDVDVEETHEDNLFGKNGDEGCTSTSTSSSCKYVALRFISFILRFK
jgi:hypothetical protein